MSRHVPANPYPDEKDTTVYEIGHGVSVIFIAVFMLLVLVPVVIDHFSRASHKENGAAFAKRRAFWFEALHPPLFDPETPAPADKRIVHHLRWLERGLDGTGYATAIRQRTQEWLSASFAEGSQKVLVGFNGWLFYRPDLRAVTGYGPLKPEPFSVMKDPELAKLPHARACIEEFAAQLQERGIKLLFVPLPLKPMVYGEEIAPSAKPGALTHPDAPAFYDALRAKGVDVLDLTADFVALREERKHVHYLIATTENREIAKQTEEALQLKKDAFLKQDTHWTPDAMRLAAEKVAAHVKARYPDALRPMARTITAVDGPPRKSMGDLVKLLDLKDPKELFDPEQEFMRVVGEGTEDKFAPIALLGDSFVNVFDDPTLGFESADKPAERIRAGFAQHLSLVLNQPLDVIAMNGKGATGVRREFAKRHDDEVRAKKLLIWVIASRDVLLSRTAAHQAGIEWGLVNFNPNRSPDASTSPAPASAASLVIEATLTEKSKNQDANGTPYRDALHAAAYDVGKVAEGALTATKIIGIQWTFKDKVMQPTAGFEMGKRYKLTLVPWDSKKDLQLLNLQDDTTAFDAERWFVEKAEPLP